jgi:hypothetical protein
MNSQKVRFPRPLSKIPRQRGGRGVRGGVYNRLKFHLIHPHLYPPPVGQPLVAFGAAKAGKPLPFKGEGV